MRLPTFEGQSRDLLKGVFNPSALKMKVGRLEASVEMPLAYTLILGDKFGNIVHRRPHHWCSLPNREMKCQVHNYRHKFGPHQDYRFIRASSTISTMALKTRCVFRIEGLLSSTLTFELLFCRLNFRNSS